MRRDRCRRRRRSTQPAAAILNDNLDPEVAALIAEDAWPGEKDVLCP
jgi:hypothetical protein